jgi:hypothetical protein
MVALRKIFNSLKDGMSVPADWFEMPETEEPPKKGAEAAREALRRGKGKDSPQPPKVDPGANTEATKASPPTERPITDEVQCLEDGEIRTVGWCRDNCPTNIECLLWR